MTLCRQYLTSHKLHLFSWRKSLGYISISTFPHAPPLGENQNTPGFMANSSRRLWSFSWDYWIFTALIIYPTRTLAKTHQLGTLRFHRLVVWRETDPATVCLPCLTSSPSRWLLHLHPHRCCQCSSLSLCSNQSRDLIPVCFLWSVTSSHLFSVILAIRGVCEWGKVNYGLSDCVWSLRMMASYH